MRLWVVGDGMAGVLAFEDRADAERLALALALAGAGAGDGGGPAVRPVYVVPAQGGAGGREVGGAGGA